MIHQAEAKVKLSYEYLNLSGEDERDDRVLDAWFRVEEQVMDKRVNRAARSQVQALVQAQARPKIAKRKKKAKRVLKSEKKSGLFGEAEVSSKGMDIIQGVEKVVED